MISITEPCVAKRGPTRYLQYHLVLYSQRLPNLQVRCLSAEIITVVSALEQCLGVHGSMEQLKVSIPLSSTKLQYFLADKNFAVEQIFCPKTLA